MLSPALPTPERLRRDAIRIWRAGVEAVSSERLVRAAMAVEASTLIVGGEPISLEAVNRIAVVGAGKAGAGMAAAVEEILGPRLLAEKHVAGWVNVPDDCLRDLGHIWLHASRPSGANEPTAAGVVGSEEILYLVESLGPDDLCIALVSGGGSALLPAPVEPITLADKLAVTRHLSAAGANIEELNTVRKQLSRIKGGGLARACRAGRLVALVISDVPGDSLDLIASGPTVQDTSRPEDALTVLERFGGRSAGIAPTVFEYLESRRGLPPRPSPERVSNHVIGSNATAVDAAGAEALRLGYRHAMLSAAQPEGPAEEVGRHLAEMALSMRESPGPDCLVSGGEPVVALVEAARRGRGGRNQQLVLAALARLQEDGARRIALVSGGTDGEDGPTDAAGAVLDESLVQRAILMGLDPADHLARNDAYTFFELVEGLLKTGPTHTNVCDLRVLLVAQSDGSAGCAEG